jgi:hydrogenase nickel incorporation protein HypB
MLLKGERIIIKRHHGKFQHSHHNHAKAASKPTSKKSGSQEIQVMRRVLDANDITAQRLRDHFAHKKVFVLNVMSSPGSGKTTLLEKTLANIMPAIKCAVIVGDICTTYDADRLAASGAPVVQINTDEFGGDCHLAAHVIEKALAGLNLDEIALLIVENIGNLVCPAEFDIGEDTRVVVLSVTEGEDKPAKYPLMFRECDAAILNKIDLLPYLDYDKDFAVNEINKIHPDMPIFEVSAKSGAGFDLWLTWIKEGLRKKFET